MKKSVAYLPKKKQDELMLLKDMIRSKISQIEMIILYGSYALNEYVDNDEQIEFSNFSSYVSEYNIMVVTQGLSNRQTREILEVVHNRYQNHSEKQTPVQFICEEINRLNREISEGRYLYTQIKDEGILLYDSGKCQLSQRRRLSVDELKRLTEEYFNEKFQKADHFFREAKYTSTIDYKLSAFYLHQACEHYYHAIRASYTLKTVRGHSLVKLLTSFKLYSDDLQHVFPRNTAREKYLFNLIKSAYSESLSGNHFLITKEDIDDLIPKVKLLRDITMDIYKKKMESIGK